MLQSQQELRDDIQQLEQRFQEQLQQSEQRFQEQLQLSEERVQQQLLHIDQNVQQARQDVQHAQVQLAGVKTAQVLTNATLHNIRAAVLNHRAVHSFLAGFSRNFHRSVKSSPGHGNVLPNAPEPRHPIPVLQVGEIIPHRFFPASPAALKRWSHRQISDLSILLNNDFGIDHTDDLQERRHKLQLYLISV